jgi:hypothetical protein
MVEIGMRIKNMDFSKFQEVTPAVDKLESQKFIFEETKNQGQSGKFQTVTLQSIPKKENLIILVTDKECFKTGAFFKKPYGQKADFVILEKKDDILHLYVVECKSGVDFQDIDEILPQIKGAIRLAKYWMLALLDADNKTINDCLPIRPQALILYTKLNNRFTSPTAFGKGLFEGEDYNKKSYFPLTVKQVKPNSTHTFDDFLSYFKTA